jgi:hypothetical protein
MKLLHNPCQFWEEMQERITNSESKKQILYTYIFILVFFMLKAERERERENAYSYISSLLSKSILKN